MEIRRHDSAIEFLERAEAWLLRSEVENNLALGIARLQHDSQSAEEGPTYWATVLQNQKVVGCAT